MAYRSSQEYLNAPSAKGDRGKYLKAPTGNDAKGYLKAPTGNDAEGYMKAPTGNDARDYLKTYGTMARRMRARDLNYGMSMRPDGSPVG